MELQERLAGLVAPLETLHGKTPGLRKLPFRAVGIILVLCLVNALVWLAAGVVLVSPSLEPKQLQSMLTCT